MIDINKPLKKAQILKFQNTDFKFSHLDTPWLESLLLEVSETSPLDKKEILLKSHFELVVNFMVKNDKVLGTPLLAKCSVSTTYQVASIKTFKNIQKELSFEFEACFLEESMQDLEEYKEETEIFINNSMHELYFLNKSAIPLEEVIHEQTFLNFNFYPTESDTEVENLEIKPK